MSLHSFDISPGSGIKIGEPESAPLLIAGPCVIENEDMTLRHAAKIAEIAKKAGMPFVFKASYDKANRTSIKSFRGPGLEDGLRILERVKHETGVLLITDVHSVSEIDSASEVVDILQIPAFLCRQTDMLVAATKSGKTVNVKKGQFISPDDVKNIINKITASGGSRLMITERGSSFGYNRLVVDYTGIVKMGDYGWPIVFDATHSVQTPGGAGEKSGGDRRFAPYLAWAAAAVGVDALFAEVHENPESALSDGANMIRLSDLRKILEKFLSIHNLS